MCVYATERDRVGVKPRETKTDKEKQRETGSETKRSSVFEKTERREGKNRADR